MTETTWTSAIVASRPGQTTQSLTRLWRTYLLLPLHRAVDAGLRADELSSLDAATLADIGYRQE